MRCAWWSIFRQWSVAEELVTLLGVTHGPRVTVKS